MNRMLQVFHVSDMHWAPSRKQAAALRAQVGRTRYWPLGHGTMGHEVLAVRALRRSVRKVIDDDPEWTVRSWLISSGDLTTWGDDQSLHAAIGFLGDIAKDCGIRAAVIYGNHDVWDQGFPAVIPDSVLDARRTRLRRNEFTGTWPLFSMAEGLGQSSPGGPTSIEATGPLTSKSVRVVSLNTILHTGWNNVLAFGEVKADRYWEGRTSPTQLQVVRGSGQSQNELRVVVTHHPLRDPKRRKLSMILKNAPEVADAFTVCGSAPTVFLSGHTHEVFPAFGSFPTVLPTGRACVPPLEDRQVQMIVGTCAQIGGGPQTGDQTWQLLRFWEDEERPGIVLERFVFSRPAGAGEFLPEEDDKGDPSEKLEI
jgi:3',5'-cyclic AMP phosphodiesterase CpdA